MGGYRDGVYRRGSLVAAAIMAVAANGQADVGQETVAPSAWCRDQVVHAFHNRHIEVHVFAMSQCPYAALALQGITQALLSWPAGSATLRMDMIGTGSDDATFVSRHGAAEVQGDKMYLCMQQEMEMREFLYAVLCLSTEPSRIPSTAHYCMDAVGSSASIQTKVTECMKGADGRSLLHNSFAVVNQRRIGESPTVFYGAIGMNQTQSAIDRLQAQHLAPDGEVLYCGERTARYFFDASCFALKTFVDGDSVPSFAPYEMLTGLNECPADGPDSEPSCVDSNVEMGSYIVLEHIMLVIFLTACGSACVRMFLRRLCPHRFQPPRQASGAAGSRQRQSRGLSATAIATLPSFVVSDGLNSTCTICFEPVADGETSFVIPCAHRHHCACMEDWVRRKAECPDCRGAIPGQRASAGPEGSTSSGRLGRAQIGVAAVPSGGGGTADDSVLPPRELDVTGVTALALVDDVGGEVALNPLSTRLMLAADV
jgi:hypothetical protein